LYSYVAFCCQEVFHASDENQKEAPQDVIPHAGEVFYRSYVDWKEMVTKNANLSDRQLSLSVMHANLHHCIKELYQIGSVTMPAIHFYAKAVLPKGAFDGYNERALSLKDAMELKADMLRAYLGDGHVNPLL